MKGKKGFWLIAAIGLVVLVFLGFFLVRHEPGGRAVAFPPAVGGGKTADFTIAYEDDFRITVSKGTVKRTFNFEDDVSGSTEVYDGSPENVESVPATVKVIDKVLKDGDCYILLLVSARGNANIQGHCGAGEDHTILWAKLDGGLTLKGKKGVVIRACQAETNVFDPSTMEEVDPDDIPSRMELRDGRLEVDFIDTRTRDGSGEYSHLSYDARHPEKGVTVEGRTARKEGKTK